MHSVGLTHFNIIKVPRQSHTYMHRNIYHQIDKLLKYSSDVCIYLQIMSKFIRVLWHRGLSQDLGTECPKLPIVKYLGTHSIFIRHDIPMNIKSHRIELG